MSGCLITHHFLFWLLRANVSWLTSCQHHFILYMESLSKAVSGKTINQPNHLSLKHNRLAECEVPPLEYRLATPMTACSTVLQHKASVVCRIKQLWDQMHRMRYNGGSYFMTNHGEVKDAVMTPKWKTARCLLSAACEHWISQACVLKNHPTKRCQEKWISSTLSGLWHILLTGSCITQTHISH